MKGLRAKCISCDRPLNIVRENKLGELPTGSPAPSLANHHGPRGPGWETAPKRALTQGDYEGFAELTCAPCPCQLMNLISLLLFK